jgi:hypothetical protein
MKIVSATLALSIAMTGCIGVAVADSWKDESGQGRWMGGIQFEEEYRPRRYYDDEEYKPRRYYGDEGYVPRRYYRERRREFRTDRREYRRGRCRIARMWDDGEYTEVIKCKRGWRRPAYIYRD